MYQYRDNEKTLRGKRLHCERFLHKIVKYYSEVIKISEDLRGLTMEYLIGVDLGTTSTKAVLFDTEGHVIASANKGYKLYRDEPDMAEEDLNEIWEAFVDAMTEVVRGANGGKIWVYHSVLQCTH